MGPPLFRGGHRLRVCRRSWGSCASMGPPLFRGGHPTARQDRGGPVALQWGHLSLEVVMLMAADGYSRRARLQWGHLSLEVVMRRWRARKTSTPCFNGATSL